MTRAVSEFHQPAPGQERGDPVPARDLVDFHLRWREFRPFAVELLAREGLGGTEAATLRALIELADRVRENDLH
jgi:hypothetical protein